MPVHAPGPHTTAAVHTRQSAVKCWVRCRASCQEPRCSGAMAPRSSNEARTALGSLPAWRIESQACFLKTSGQHTRPSKPARACAGLAGSLSVTPNHCASSQSGSSKEQVTSARPKSHRQDSEKLAEAHQAVASWSRPRCCNSCPPACRPSPLPCPDGRAHRMKHIWWQAVSPSSKLAQSAAAQCASQAGRISQAALAE